MGSVGQKDELGQLVGVERKMDGESEQRTTRGKDLNRAQRDVVCVRDSELEFSNQQRTRRVTRRLQRQTVTKSRVPI